MTKRAATTPLDPSNNESNEDDKNKYPPLNPKKHLSNITEEHLNKGSLHGKNFICYTFELCLNSSADCTDSCGTSSVLNAQNNVTHILLRTFTFRLQKKLVGFP